MNRRLNFLRLALEIVAAVALYLHLRLISLPHRPSRDSSRSLKEPAELPKPPDLPDLPEPPGPPDDRPQCGNFWDVPTLYINLDRAADRRVWVEKDLKNLRPVDMFRRLNASDIADVETVELSKRVSNFLTLTETAVVLSHLRAMEHGLQHFPKAPYFLVLEDDVSFSTVPRWAGTLADLLDEATREHPDWEILNVACSNWRDSSAFLAGYFFQQYKFKSFRSFKGPEFFGAIAYAVRKTPGLSDLISAFKRWKELGAAKKASSAWYNATEEGALLQRLFSEPSDWMLYRQLKSYLTTVPLLVPNNTELSSLVHDEKTSNHLEQAAVSLSFWSTQPTSCQGMESSTTLGLVDREPPDSDQADTGEEESEEIAGVLEPGPEPGPEPLDNPDPASDF